MDWAVVTAPRDKERETPMRPALREKLLDEARNPAEMSTVKGRAAVEEGVSPRKQKTKTAVERKVMKARSPKRARMSSFSWQKTKTSDGARPSIGGFCLKS